MKAVILAGGYGTRISEESHLRPKPMIEIGGMPILWHIMKWYSKFGINEFIICAGYKQDFIKEWFANYFIHTSDITFDFTSDNEVIVHTKRAEPWKVTVVDTGLDTMTGGRIKRIQKYVGNEVFCLTYGDGVSDVVAAFDQLQHQYQWGTSLPYMLSGANSIPQKDVMEWVQNRIYSFNSIVRALDNRKSHKDDNAKYPLLNVDDQYQNVLIVGGGETVIRHITAIKTFVEKNEVALVFATARFAGLFENIECPKYYCLLGNESKRLSANIDTKSQFKGICVMPPYPRKMGTDVPKHVQDKTYELPQISFINKYLDSCTTLAVELAHMLKAGVGKLYVVGYDGYQGHVLTEKELTLNRENEEIFDSYTAWSGRKIISLLPTLYKTLDVKSLYNLL